MERLQQAARFGIVLGTVVLVLRLGAWWLTGSAGLFAAAVEAGVSVAAAIMALVARGWAETPADANHTYGHEKAEFFAAVVEGALIVIASFTILAQAWQDALHPALLPVPWAGLALSGLATALGGAWALALRRLGGTDLRRRPWADFATGLLLIAGVALAAWTQEPAIDTALAVLVAAQVLWWGLRLVNESVGGLMDAAPPAEVVERIRRLVGEHAHGALEAHDLRTRHAGRLTYLEFHLVVPGELRVSEAHAICDRIEAALREDMEHLVITIHVEPEAKAKHQGILVL